jgi:2-oxoisovalerate dehydrogenase E1 component
MSTRNDGDEPLDRRTMVGLYETMVRIRRCEERLVRSHQAGLIYGGCHTYIGEESIAAGVSAHLRLNDFAFGTHRGHGHAVAKGVPPFELFAELYGRAGGASGGRGGSMHVFKPEVGLMGTNGIVGPGILLATGAAYAFKLARSDRIAVAYFGDGAVNNGAFHEGCNLAANWGLPVLLVCENNLYATEIAFASVTKQVSVVQRAEAYGLTAEAVDASDVVEVYRKAGAAAARARAGGGPTLLECRTYRHRAHSEGMRDSGYRTREEVERWKERDPLPLFAKRLAAEGVATAEEIAAIDARIADEVERADAEARASPHPDPASVLGHVLARAEGGRDA